MKLSFDVMGHEGKLSDAIKAARKLVAKHREVQIILVGNKNQIEQIIQPNEFEILDCEQAIQMTDSPIEALRKTNTSM